MSELLFQLISKTFDRIEYCQCMFPNVCSVNRLIDHLCFAFLLQILQILFLKAAWEVGGLDLGFKKPDP